MSFLSQVQTYTKELYSEKKHEESKEKTRHKANQVKSNCKMRFGMVTRHVLSASTSHQSSDTWLIDSGDTCHICNNKELFIKYQTFKPPQKVSVGCAGSQSEGDYKDKYTDIR